MPLYVRNRLPFVVAAAWLAFSWWWILGAPSLGDTVTAMFRVPERYSTFEMFTWFCAMLLAMVLVDRGWCALMRRWVGVDPMKVHWSWLRNRDGRFFCAACRSIFLLPPEDFSEEGMVHCGDCGHAVATYGEMKPYLDPRGRVRSLSRRL